MEAEQRVGAVILAAGTARRFGSPKMLVVVDGRTLLEHAVATAQEAGLAPVVAVVPVWLSRPSRLEADWLRWVRNPFPERGLSLSLRLGLTTLGEAIEAAVILLGDQPRVPAETVLALLAARGVRPIVAARAGSLLAPPVLIERSHFGLADDLRGDTGLRAILDARPELVTAVQVPGHPPDIDTPDDLDRLRDG